MSKILEDIFRSLGRSDALVLREQAPELTQTEVIDREIAIPNFDHEKDYSSFPAGAPVADEGQVWLLITPHNASYYEGRPSTLRALWSLAHTKNPERAKAWVDPLGTSGMYMKDEVYKDENGKIWKSKVDNNVYKATDLPSSWEEVIL